VDEDDVDVEVDETVTDDSALKAFKKDLSKYKNKIYDDDEDVAPDMFNGVYISKIAELYEDAPSDESMEEDQEFTSLIDDIDELLFFLEAFRVFSNREVPIYQKLLQTFTQEEQVKLQELGNEANNRQTNKQNK